MIAVSELKADDNSYAPLNYKVQGKYHPSSLA